MCLLTFIPGGQEPNIDNLYNGAIENDDGHGYAIVGDGRLIIGKGLDKDDVLADFARDRALNPDGPALFHSRWTTHGKSTVDNCHPFHVGGDRRTVLAHNGILPKEAWPKPGDARSDTRVAAETLLPSLGSMRFPWLRSFVEDWMTPANKMVILTVNPKYGGNSFILNEDAGVWDDGIWYSNQGYKPYRYTAAWLKDKPKWWDDMETLEEEAGSGFRCLDCLEEWSACDCFIPPRHQDKVTRETATAKNGYPLS